MMELYHGMVGVIGTVGTVGIVPWDRFFVRITSVSWNNQ